MVFNCILLIYVTSTGIKSGTSFLIEDGALPWIVQNANNEAAAIRRHIELALFHMAQQGNWTPWHAFLVFSETIILLQKLKELG